LDYKFPDNLKYTASHEWVEINEKIGTVGITDYAQHHLGDIVFVELPELGMVFEKGSNAAEIESVKAVGDLLMPLSGEILEINEDLAENPEFVNESPYEKGWMVKIRFSHPGEIDDLLTADKYEALTQEEMN
jgi:glycine cleavage system H protein